MRHTFIFMLACVILGGFYSSDTFASKKRAKNYTKGDSILQLPPVCYAVEGIKYSIYSENVVLLQDPKKYKVKFKCNIGETNGMNWTLTPTKADIGDHPMEMTLYNLKGTVLAKATTIIKVSSIKAGAKDSLRILMVGDSLTEQAKYVKAFVRLCRSKNGPELSMIGSIADKLHWKDKILIRHEGYSGWSWGSFFRKKNPFLDKKNRFNFKNYIATVANNNPPKLITILLGINDVFWNVDSIQLGDQRINTMFKNAEKMIAEFKKACPNVTIAIMTVPPGNGNAPIYPKERPPTRWLWRQIQQRIVMSELEEFGNREKEGIFLVPIHPNIDTKNGFKDILHPNQIGGDQIGQSLYGWLKWWLGKNKK